MKTNVIESERLTVEVADAGAELIRIYDKANSREVLWNADPAVWNRHAPILFPMVGVSNQGQYRLNGKVYPMTQHGFARDMDFTLTSCDSGSIWYALESTEQTKENYPFDFRLEVGHRLFDNQIQVIWRVENTGKDTMYYNIGAHPAFRIPEGLKKTDMKIAFDGQSCLPYINIEDPGCGCALADQVHTLKLENGTCSIDEHFFDKGVYIFENEIIDKASICYGDGSPYVSVLCEDFTYFGLWTKPTHPFICLEPWFGRCDDLGYTGELKDKTGIMQLDAGDTFEASYYIVIH
ncbi:aldose 1-epimerase family protein [Lachnotalea sp. AF33-28]|uniref:aldose 1-epimerase family protein n=1 Tax=Lachnotalea sp. AF33-28 TaxID=2292046 RepID=UPI000E4B847E|nr:aldose 1-epimerase family protein [Lachnotalea sp. AF33-28]RHP34402.1 aldose 1-epimerase family protein [Lachnotalea sp. AF33-28]